MPRKLAKKEPAEEEEGRQLRKRGRPETPSSEAQSSAKRRPGKNKPAADSKRAATPPSPRPGPPEEVEEEIVVDDNGVSVEKPRRGRKKLGFESKEQLEATSSRWLQMQAKERRETLKKFYGDGPYPCLSIGKKCGTFPTLEKAFEHNSTCIQPVYMTYKNRLPEFRKLSKLFQQRYVREVITLKKEAPCLVCGRVYAHANGLQYHVERCGLEEKDQPWKCWRCGFEGTKNESKSHLEACQLKADEAREEMLSCKPEPEESDTDEADESTVFGALDDTNLRSGKAIEKCGELEGMAKVEAREAVERIIAMTGQTRRKRSGAPSVSKGVLPVDSAKVKVANTGQPRFRFRKANTLSLVTDMTDFDDYRATVQKTKKTWDEEKSHQNNPLSSKHTSFNQPGEFPDDLLKKSSIGFNLRSDTAAFVSTPSLPSDLVTLNSFESTSMSGAGNENWITVAYAGGPVHSLKFAPNQLGKNEEVLLVAAYPNDEELLVANWREQPGFVQFWTVRHGEQSTVRPWFILQSKHGAVMNASWLDCQRLENDQDLLGFVALATAQGTILIYRIEVNSMPQLSKKVKVPSVVCPEPLLVLRQEEHKDEEVQVGRYPPPLTKVDWSTLDNSRYISAVSAAGYICIWDLTGNPNEAKILKEKEWSSPATDLCFAKEHELVVGFREKLVRVYDVRSGDLLLEESTVRTAGSRVVSAPRILSGFLTFQSEYFASSDETPANGISYVCSDDITKGYFVVPLAARHDLQLWDAAVSPTTAILATCGVDGQLLLSGNGRIVPRLSRCDSGFSVIRSSMLVSKRRVEEEANGEGAKAMDAVFNYQELRKRTWLEISLEPRKEGRTVPYASLELRAQSLNAVAANLNTEKPIVITAGQAGLLFIRPCRLDAAGTNIDPLELISSLTTSRQPPKPKEAKKRGRPPKKEVEA